MSKPIPQVQNLFPPDMVHLFSARPTLWFESDGDYDSLLSQLLADHDVKNAVDFMLVKELADVTWEIHRLRSLETAAIRADLPGTAWKILSTCYPGHHFEFQKPPAAPDKNGKYSAAERQKHAEEVNKMMANGGIKASEILYRIYKGKLHTITDIEHAIDTTVRRRDRMLRMMEERRNILSVMGSLAHTPEDVTDMGVGEVNSPGAAA